MTETPPPYDVLRRTLAYVLEHPDEHDQSSWGYRYDADELRWLADHGRPAPACGTAFCLAGHAAVTVAGARPVWSDGDTGSLEWVVPLGRDDVADEDNWVDVADYAAEVLGVGVWTTSLFDGHLTLANLAQLVNEATGGVVDVRAEANAAQVRLDAAAAAAAAYRDVRVPS